MGLSFTRFSWLWLGGKNKERVSNGSVKNSLGLGLKGETESVKLKSMKGGDKLKSREERSRRIDKEYDAVLVASDGDCLSESESDWSIGWLEPHNSGFHDHGGDDSFAVLVPCYRNDCKEPSVQFLGAVKNIPDGYSAGGREYMKQWLSSLQNV